MLQRNIIMRLFNLFKTQSHLSRKEKKNFIDLLQHIMDNDCFIDLTPKKGISALHPKAGNSVIFACNTAVFLDWTMQQHQTYHDCHFRDGHHFRFKPLYEQYLHELGWKLTYSFEPAFADYVEQFGWDVVEACPSSIFAIVTRYGLGFRLYCD